MKFNPTNSNSKSGRSAIGHSTCPHDCPSACALDVELRADGSVGRLRGSMRQTYTAGVICAKVARYAERLHHRERLTHPLKRIDAKGAGAFVRISWDEALDEIVSRFNQIEREFGAQAIWPYYYAGTMGKVMRDGINRLTHAKKYSRFYGSICANIASAGFLAGTGKLMGPDPREIAQSDCVVIWGTNAVATQVNVMTHAARARKERGAQIIVVDVYDNPTMAQADLALRLRPGTDGALACALMHVLFRDDLADRQFLRDYTDAPDALEAHLQSRTPQWASAITGLDAALIEQCAAMIGARKRSFFRLGFGFSRSRNGAANMHAATCVPAVLGAWAYEGGGALYDNSGIYHLDSSLIAGADLLDPAIRRLDQCRIGAILAGESADLQGGPPVRALLIQNTNPMCVAPDQNRVRQGFAREDLFTVVHEQFMTDTALYADIVLPATMFLEHDDFYTGGGHQYIGFGPKLAEPPGECRSNHDVICALARRLGVEHRGFNLSARELIDETLQKSGWGGLDALESRCWLDAQPPFEQAHYRGGFAWPDGKFRFKADWAATPYAHNGLRESWRDMPTLPDHWPVTEETDEAHPFRLATSPARQFLNSTFSNTPGSIERERRPEILIHPEDAREHDVADGAVVLIGNQRGQTRLHVRISSQVARGVLVSEGLWPNSSFLDGRGINVLTSAQSVAPFGGAAFHDNKVWLATSGVPD